MAEQHGVGRAAGLDGLADRGERSVPLEADRVELESIEFIGGTLYGIDIGFSFPLVIFEPVFLWVEGINGLTLSLKVPFGYRWPGTNSSMGFYLAGGPNVQVLFINFYLFYQRLQTHLYLFNIGLHFILAPHYSFS